MSGIKVSEPHWYKIIVDNGCELCSASSSAPTKIRMAGKRPDNPEERYEYEPLWACNDHFL